MTTALTRTGSGTTGEGAGSSALAASMRPELPLPLHVAFLTRHHPALTRMAWSLLGFVIALLNARFRVKRTLFRCVLLLLLVVLCCGVAWAFH